MDMDDRLSVEAKTKAERRTFVVAFVSFLAIVFIFLIISITCDHLSDPSLYIQDLYVVPSLNKTTTFNTSVFINLEFKRAADFSYPNYKDFEMTLFYGKNRGLPVAHHVVKGFSLGRRKKFHVKAAMEAPTLPWEEASRVISSGSKVVLRVELVVRRWPESCEILSSHIDGAEVFAADVAVDASGHKVSKKLIKLNYKGQFFN